MRGEANLLVNMGKMEPKEDEGLALEELLQREEGEADEENREI